MTGTTTLIWLRASATDATKHIFALEPRDKSYWEDVPPFPGSEHLPLARFGLYSGLVYDETLRVIPFTLGNADSESVAQCRELRVNRPLLESTFPGKILWLFTSDREQLPELALQQLSSALQRLPTNSARIKRLRWVIEDYAGHAEAPLMQGLWWTLWDDWPVDPLYACVKKLSPDELMTSVGCGYVFTDKAEKVACERF